MSDIDLRSANSQSNEANHSALRNVRAYVIEVNKANGMVSSDVEPGASKVMPAEPFSELINIGRVLEPPFDMLTLAMMYEHSSELGQCIEAMEVNCDGFGHRFVPRKKVDKDDSVEAKAMAEERAKLINFFTYCTDVSFTQFRRRLRKDLESTGNAYFEVMRNGAGEIMGFTHVPSYQMRLGRLDRDAMLVDRKVLEVQPDGSTKLKVIKEYRRFRSMIQSRAILRKSYTIDTQWRRWFKEFGDPRVLNIETGMYDEPGGTPTPVDKQANEMVHLKLYSSRSPYGLPRYVGNLLSIFGDRAAEEINYTTFRNNNIPSMVVCVSNGQLTGGSIERIKTFVESQVQGSDNYSKFLILEGEPIAEEGEDGGQVKIDIKPIANSQIRDALFQNYSVNNQDKIRRAFRIPPIYVGRSDEYTRSTADTSRKLADEQVFAPERSEFDELMNRVIFPAMGIVLHRFVTNTPNTTDNSELVKILAASEKTGGMTPRIARRVIEQVLGEDLPEFPDDFPADIPFSMTMAEAVKNMADPAEPGQQVTALKALQNMGILTSSGELTPFTESDTQEVIIAKLSALNGAVEKLWRANGASSIEESV